MNIKTICLGLTASTLIALGLPSSVIAVTATLTANDPNSRINIHTAPSIQSPSPQYGLPGDTVEILRQTKEKDGYIWYYVQFKVSGAKGWVRQDLINLSSSPNSSSPHNNNRQSTPSTSASIITAQKQSVKAELSYTKHESPNTWNNLHLWITRQGKRMEAPSPERFKGDTKISALEKPQLNVIDLEGDRDPEVIVTLFTGGAHCCNYSLIYYFNPQANQYQVLKQKWGNLGFNPKDLKDLDGDGHLELVTVDDRFAYAFSSYVSSYPPILILSYQQGKFINVTRKYPKLVRKNAAEAWESYKLNIKSQLLPSDPGESVRPPLAAYLALKSLLGEKKEGWQRVKAAYNLPDRNKFFQELDKFLRENGYY
jgi:hypothetical protein